jgi:hypothetical protein
MGSYFCYPTKTSVSFSHCSFRALWYIKILRSPTNAQILRILLFGVIRVSVDQFQSITCLHFFMKTIKYPFTGSHKYSKLPKNNSFKIFAARAVLWPPLSYSYQYHFDSGRRNILKGETLWFEKYESRYGYRHFKVWSRDERAIDRLWNTYTKWIIFNSCMPLHQIITSYRN